MGVDWSSACKAAMTRPLQEATVVNFCFCGTLIAGFCTSAAYSARMLLRFWKLDSKVGVWPLYGWFALLMCVGCVTGAVAWVARMLELHYLYVSVSDLQRDFSEFLSGQALKYYWKAVFSVFYSLEFALLSIAKLLVLDRLVAFALPTNSALADVGSASLRSKLTFVFRATIFAAFAGDVTGAAGNIASAVYCVKIGNMSNDLRGIVLSNTSAPLPDASNSPLLRDIVDALLVNNRVQSVQLFSELAVLLVIVVVVASVGALCFNRIHQAQSGVPQSSRLVAKVQHSARTLKLRVVRTVLVIFFAFTLRSAFAIMYATATAFANISGCSTCSSLGGVSCNQYDDLKRFLIQTPVLQCIVIFIASPVALCLTLRSMTPGHMLRNAHTDAMHPLMEHPIMPSRKP